MADQEKPTTGDEFHPRGTVLIMILFAITLAVLWGSIYLILISQGATNL